MKIIHNASKIATTHLQRNGGNYVKAAGAGIAAAGGGTVAVAHGGITATILTATGTTTLGAAAVVAAPYVIGGVVLCSVGAGVINYFKNN